MHTVVIISVITAFLTCAGIACILIVRHRSPTPQPEEALTTVASSFTKPSGTKNTRALIIHAEV